MSIWRVDSSKIRAATAVKLLFPATPNYAHGGHYPNYLCIRKAQRFPFLADTVEKGKNEPINAANFRFT